MAISYPSKIAATMHILQDPWFKRTRQPHQSTCLLERTKKRIAAIIVVHIFGNTVDLTSIINLCKKRNIKIIEDASESLGSFLIKRNKRLHSGTSGDIGCISFNANKILTTGAGGAVVTNNINYLRFEKDKK